MDLIIPLYSWDLYGKHSKNKSEQMESSALWASDKGCCSDAPEGAAGQDPVELGTGGTPLIEEEHQPCSQTSENLEGLTKKVSTLDPRLPRKNCCGAARTRARKAKLAEAPTGASDGGQPQPASGDQPQNLQDLSTSAAHHRGGSASAEQKPQRVGSIPRAHIHNSGRPGALRVAGRLRGPNRLGNLVMPGPLERASGWPL